MEVVISKSKKPDKQSLMPELIIKRRFHLERKAHRITQNIKIKNEHNNMLIDIQIMKIGLNQV